MRAYEFLVENAPAPKKIGREFNHLEDFVFTEPNGAAKAVKYLKEVEQNAKDMTHKWDGSPTVYWGRDADGTFRLVGKNNWGREEGRSSSAEELQQFILSRGKGEDWRPRFAAEMAAMWDIFEAATPHDFVGYLYGDILFHPGKPYAGADGRMDFQPNQTNYSILGNSDTGRKIAGRKAAVAVHKWLENFGDKDGHPFTEVDQFNNKDLAVFGLTYVNHQPAVHAENLPEIETLSNKWAQTINKFLTPVAGMGYLQDTLYTFVNTQSKAKQLDNINTAAFLDWLSASPAKFKKISEHNNKYEGILNTIFELVVEIMKAKNEVIRELDSAEGDIIATTNGQPGGEGYVYKDSKWVPRDRWTPYREN